MNRCNRIRMKKNISFYSRIVLIELIEFIFYCLTEALRLCNDCLTPFEKTEILNYPEVWYLGTDAQKVIGVEGAASNHGYDDEHGSYVKVSSCHVIHYITNIT